MRILITGGAGFIGSAVVRFAISLGHSIVNVDALTYAGNLKNLAKVADSNLYFFEKVDIRDRAQLDRVFELYAPDAVMHLAAETHVDRSIMGPSDFLSTNIFGTFTLLEAAKSYWNSRECFEHFRFLHVSTDEVFGSLSYETSEKFTEFSKYNPRSPYSASKASSDHLVRAWGYTYGLPILISNCSNNYGPYHYPEKLIPLVIVSALCNKKIPVYGSGKNVRDWLYVEDHAAALLAIIKKGSIGESYNIGASAEASNIAIVEQICTILDSRLPRSLGSYADLIDFVADRPGHDERYAIDANKLQNELDWYPSVNLQEGLEKTVDWYIENESWWRHEV